MREKDPLKSPVDMMYLIPFLRSSETYISARDFIGRLTSKEIKMSNMAVAIRIFVKMGYLFEKDDGKKNRYGQKIFEPNKDKFLDDIFSELGKVTERFTYSFRIDGRLQTKRRRFSYDAILSSFKEVSKKSGFDGFLFSIFSVFCERVLAANATESGVSRKMRQLSYFNLISDFLNGMSIPSDFIEEYYGYMDDEEIFYFERSKRKSKEDELEAFRDICSDYILLKNASKNSIMARAVSIYRD